MNNTKKTAEISFGYDRVHKQKVLHFVFQVDSYDWQTNSSDGSYADLLHNNRQELKPKPQQQPTKPRQRQPAEAPRAAAKVRYWTDSEEDDANLIEGGRAAAAAAGGQDGGDDVNDWSPPASEAASQTVPTYAPLRRQIMSVQAGPGEGGQSLSTDSRSRPSHLENGSLAAPQPTMMGIGRGLGRERIAPPPGNASYGLLV